MKKKFIFTKDSSFTSVQDKMHQEVTEHIIQDDETKKLYHYVVSYGSWFSISKDSVFMSHLLSKIGLTGFGKNYIADGCKIDLPWEPYNKKTRHSIVELPEDIKLEDVELDASQTKVSDRFKQTFLGKSYVIQSQEDNEDEYGGEDLLKLIFGCVIHQLAEFKDGDKVYPFYCVLTNFGWNKKEDLIDVLGEGQIGEHPEVFDILEKFASIDIKNEIEKFGKETGNKHQELCKELLQRQKIVKKYLHSKEQASELSR